MILYRSSPVSVDHLVNARSDQEIFDAQVCSPDFDDYLSTVAPRSWAKSYFHYWFPTKTDHFQNWTRVTQQYSPVPIFLVPNTKSAVADHVLSEEHSQPHEIDWQSVRILGRAQGTTERRMKEAMLIYQRHPKMNRDIGMERSSVWNSVLWTCVFLPFISRSFLLSRLQCDHHR